MKLDLTYQMSKISPNCSNLHHPNTHYDHQLLSGSHYLNYKYISDLQRYYIYDDLYDHANYHSANACDNPYLMLLTAQLNNHSEQSQSYSGSGCYLHKSYHLYLPNYFPIISSTRLIISLNNLYKYLIWLMFDTP